MASITLDALAEMGFSVRECNKGHFYSKGTIRLLYNNGWIVY